VSTYPRPVPISYSSALESPPPSVSIRAESGACQLPNPSRYPFSKPSGSPSPSLSSLLKVAVTGTVWPSTTVTVVVNGA